jgi:hypothetical protein
MIAIRSGGQDELSPDARNLPEKLTRVKQKISPQQNAADKHIETPLLVVNKGPMQRLVVSHVVAPDGSVFGSVRWFAAADGKTFLPSKKGCMIPRRHVEAVARALLEVAR